MIFKRYFLLLSLPLLSVVLTACDAGGDVQNEPLAPNSFKAVVEGSSVDKHNLAGSLAVQGSDWNGSAFLFDVGGRFDNPNVDTSLVYFSLNLSPDFRLSSTALEGINITYLGTDLAPGTFDIVAIDEDSDRGGEFEEGVFRADYYRISASEDTTRFVGDFEMYPAKLGSITLSEVSTETVEGSFTFEAEVCRCFNLNDLLDRLKDQIGDGRNGGDPGDWENPFEDYEIDRQLNAEGSFNVDVRTTLDFDFEDDGDGVRINRNPGQGRGR